MLPPEFSSGVLHRLEPAQQVLLQRDGIGSGDRWPRIMKITRQALDGYWPPGHDVNYINLDKYVQSYMALPPTYGTSSANTAPLLMCVIHAECRIAIDAYFHYNRHMGWLR